ncbi:MAG: single-stranded DNA-binding protein [Streptosporangiales bacterium]|nr:single-stranded DNA-binding protein [Streptosporangiales bacterium]
MNDTYVTVVGNVVTDPAHVKLDSGVHVLSMRLASTTRRYDRALGEWRDASTLYLTVSCWRALAENVAASVSKGDPLVVTGRLRVRNYPGGNGERRVSVEVEASAVGHDLSRGVTRFQKGSSRSLMAERQAAQELADAWALTERVDAENEDGRREEVAAESAEERPAA